MSGSRTDIEAHAGPVTERLIDGSQWLQVRLRMFDHGVDHPQPDVVCDLRPGEARELGFTLLASAEYAERLSSMRRSAGIPAGGVAVGTGLRFSGLGPPPAQIPA